jgi:hypothetical protein
MSKEAKDLVIISGAEATLPASRLVEVRRELTNVRDDFRDNKYIEEAIRSLNAGALRGAIGSYWNSVADDLRCKILHRSLDLFNKEMNLSIKDYEGFQDHVTDHNLIEGAYKIGVLDREAKKVLHHARDTRNIFDGHPDSSDPGILKVFNFIADCNKYVLSKEYPVSVIDTGEYILKMDSPNFNRHTIAVEQAFSDLPEVYKNEMINKFFTLYLSDDASTQLRGNIEFCLLILWETLDRNMRRQIGGRFDKELVAGDQIKVDRAIDFMALINGLRYVANASRRIVFEPKVKALEDNLDQWAIEGTITTDLVRLGTVIPASLIDRYVTALTLTYIGYGGYFSWAAQDNIEGLFAKFDNSSIEAFINTIKDNKTLRMRIHSSNPRQRMRALGRILLENTSPRKDLQEFLEILVDKKRSKELTKILSVYKL